MKYIVESVLNYVRKENTNYAILLNGKWGSGKTYFWENVLRPEIEKVKVGGRKQKTIYVSLYGISSIDEISRRIFLDNFVKKIPFLQQIAESKWGGKLTEMTKMAMGYVKTLEIPGLKQVLDSEINYENLLDFTDTVLCFDDLERVNIDITDVMGYINNFVEHDGVKVIIIGNENEISERIINQNIELKMLVSSFVLDKEGAFQKQSEIVSENKKEKKSSKELILEKTKFLFDKANEYKRIKEKLIGKTLTFVPDYPDLINTIVNQVSNKELKEFLRENLGVINDTFRYSGTENIRILKHALDDFELIYSKVMYKYSHMDHILPLILKFTLAASFEIKSGAEGNEELEKLNSNDDFLSVLITAGMLEKTENKYLQEFKSKYYGAVNIFNNLMYFKFVEVLVRKGIFNEEIFEQEMNNIAERVIDKTPLHVKFIKKGYWELSDEDFNEAVEHTYQKLICGEVHFVLYFRAFILYRHLIEKGLFKKKLEELKGEFSEGLEKAGREAEYYENLDTFFLGTEIRPEDQDLREFKNRIITINQELWEEKQSRQVQELMEYLRTDFDKFLVEMQDKYCYIPVFSYYNIDELFESIVVLSNPDIVSMIQLIKKRYKLVGDLKLYLDLDNLKLLRDKINEYVSGKDITLKLSLLRDLADTIEKVSEMLEKQIPKEKVAKDSE
ncbi:hypothetical protein HPK02_07170 [Anoxybacillus flavithermus]|uniref:P-loop NTPase fold protein n=1 Tax=Anoxybacillus flavithermus TaxID=33934 RepID=UPI00186754D6|nr:P-loop NTPase fold protein [Anoxybacillus flavithermus]MBE2918678.1 hypothetical protein [Anoxybacillus flavithermus]